MTITNTSIEFEFPALKEAQAQIDAKQKAIGEVLAEAGPDFDLSKVKAVAGGKDAVLAYIRETNDELADLTKERDGLLEIAKAAKGNAGWEPATEPGDDRPGRTETKTFGERFAESEARTVKERSVSIDVQLKTLFQTSAGWAPESVRSGRVVLDAQRPVQVTDLFPQIPTSQAAYKYMEETTFTNNAAERAEGGAYGEAALVLTERSATIESVGVWLPVTDEQMEDEPGAAAYVDARLPFMLSQRIDGQLLVGDGSTPNIRGVNNATSIQTQAKGADPVPDAVHKGITKVRVTGRAMPGAVVFHPNDWQDIRLLRTADGVYIWGNPSEAGPERIWGLQVVQSDAQTENTAVVGDFANYALLVVRRGIEVLRTNSHASDFVNGKQAIRASVRLASVFLRGEAFAKITGI